MADPVTAAPVAASVPSGDRSHLAGQSGPAGGQAAAQKLGKIIQDAPLHAAGLILNELAMPALKAIVPSQLPQAAADAGSRVTSRVLSKLVSGLFKLLWPRL